MQLQCYSDYYLLYILLYYAEKQNNVTML